MKDLLICILERGSATSLMERLRGLGAEGGTVMHGRGTASRTILSLLGLGESRKDILLSVVERRDIDRMVEEAGCCCGEGVAFVVKEGQCMENRWGLLTVVVEKGYADAVMAEARKAGAKGGTIVHGHGTANEDDSAFHGMHLIPEKEILLIVAGHDVVGEIRERISTMKCLGRKGMGVLFTVPVSSFRILGKENR